MIRLRAHAKVNLALRVGPRGDDGYHPIATVFQTVSLADLLYAELCDGGAAGSWPRPSGAAAIRDGLLELTVDGAELGADNTVARAVHALARLVAPGGAPPELRLHLVKRIPIGAGLGGGSSDAAAALAACGRLWGLEGGAAGRPISPAANDILLTAAKAVGADVGFFLVGGTALGTGRGCKLEPLTDLRRCWLVVVAPRAAISTADAYHWFDAFHTTGAEARGRKGAVAPGENGAAPPPVRGEEPPRREDDTGEERSPAGGEPEPPSYRPELDPAWMANDLAPAVIAHRPEVEDARRALLATGAAPAQMTGSGAASFGAFSDRRLASRAAKHLCAAGFWARACITIDADQHLRSWFPL